MSNNKKAKGGRQKAAKTGSNEVRVKGHPRAQRQIQLAKSYAGLAAFGLVAWASYRGGVSFPHLALRALMWGMAAYLVVWALGVYLWRHIAVAEVRAAEKRWRERKEAEEEQVRKLTKVLEDNGMPTSGTGRTVPNL